MEESTNRRNLTEIYEEEVTFRQYMSAAFGGLGMLPNIFLIYLLLKSNLVRLPKYYIILNWSIFNIVSIVILMYLYLTPNENLEEAMYYFLYCLRSAIISVVTILVALLNIHYVLKSEKLYKLAMYALWLVAFALSISLFFSCFTDIMDMTDRLEPLQNICLCIFILAFVINLFILVLQSGKYKNYKATTIISFLFLLCCICDWSIGKDYFDSQYSIYMTVASIFLFQLNGFVNLIILLRYDTDIKDYIALKDEKSANVKDVEL